MKQLMLGNEAAARGLYEGGCRVVSSYPGTPSTEITEYAATYDDFYTEWAPNEKVAMEVALGAAIAGGRAFCGMKHVGLNVAADPLFTASYTGVNAGLVIGVADDQGMHSSQNEQDSRHYAVAAKLPMLEPSDSQECKDFIMRGFALSEQFDTPVIVRFSTRISHSQSLVELGERGDDALREYVKNPQKYVMMPGNAKGRHVVVEQRMSDLAAYCDTSDLNVVEMHDTKIGVIAAGIAYQYAREALGDNASYLKLGIVHPLPATLIADFASKVDELWVIEELDPIIETFCRANGIDCKGKAEFSLLGEYTAARIRHVVLGEALTADESEPLPVRPPVLCPGCPHRGIFYTLSSMKLTVSGDIGCYTLGALPPLAALDTTICMGASVSALHGINTACGPEQAKRTVGVIGDSTFIHSGITGLIDIVYNRGLSTMLILDNSITGMTGHQQNPTTGYTIKGDPTAAVDLEALCRAVGIGRVSVCDPFDLEGCKALLEQELAAPEPSVIIVRRPCALLKSVRHEPPFSVDEDACIGCKMCMKIGCPAISMRGKKSHIDHTLCVGCGLCLKMCKFGAIKTGKEANQ